MIRSTMLAALLLPLSAGLHAQGDTDCRAIAAATVAELKAGYTNWDENAEHLARAAAGAACVKATTAAPSRAAAASAPQADSQSLSSTVVRANGVVEPESVASTPVAETSSAAETEAEEKSDESWNPFSDIKFNKVSARPNRKPYERKRHSLDDDEE